MRRGELDAVVLIPRNLDADLRSGLAVRVPVLVSGSVEASQAAETDVSSVVARHGAAVKAATFATAHTDRSFDGEPGHDPVGATRDARRAGPHRGREQQEQHPARGLQLQRTHDARPVRVHQRGGRGRCDDPDRKFGIFSRALAAPIRPRDLVFGETLCYLALSLGQALLIVVVGTVMFGVSWGNPVAAAALIGMWALVGTGAGMASGTLFRTAEQAGAIGPAVGIAFGMLGGCMWPLEIVPQSVSLAGHVTPHALAVDAWVTLLSRGGGLVDIAGYLAILATYAVVLLAHRVLPSSPFPGHAMRSGRGQDVWP